MHHEHERRLACPPNSGGSGTLYTFDHANRLTSVAQKPMRLSATVGTYDAGDRPMCVQLPNSVSATYGYDADSRVTHPVRTSQTPLLGSTSFGLVSPTATARAAVALTHRRIWPI